MTCWVLLSLSDPPNMKNPAVRNARALLTFHHIILSEKRRIIKQSAKENGLHGICKIGYPGVLAVEGHEEKVAAYVREIKVHLFFLLFQIVNI